MKPNLPTIFRCTTIDAGMKIRYGEVLHLEKGKALRLEKKGLIKILGENKEELNLKRYTVYPRKKVLNNRVETGFERSKKLKIPLIIPFSPNGRIGEAYNNALSNLVEGWVLFIDHDVLLVNPYWWDICNAAINHVGLDAGWITCYTNRIGCKFQKAPNVNTQTDDIKYHRQFALDLFKKNRGKIRDLTNAKGGRFSGMFILTHKQAWIDAGGFKENIGFFNVDCRYFTSLKNAGYKLFLMEDLYVYHGYFRETLKPIFGKDKNGTSTRS